MEQYLSLINELLEIKDELYGMNLITPFGGNLSIRCPDDPNKVLITPSSVYKKNLHPDQMLLVDLDGRVLNETKFKASSENPIHLTLLRDRPDLNAVIHTHPPYTTIAAITGIEMQPITSDAVLLNNIPIVEWTTTGTAESGRIISEALSTKGYFVVVRNHGLFVCGPTIQFAAGITIMLEITCKQLVICKLLGGTQKLLSQDTIEVIHELLKKGGS
jgi:L-ribulose-5-phosphate 4-epimerase